MNLENLLFNFTVSSSPTDIKLLLKKFGIHPDKRLGQNFLIKPSTLSRIAQIAEINKENTVLEIGAGIGNLTVELARWSQRVVAVEFDKRLTPILSEFTLFCENVEIIQGDILELDLKNINLPDNYLVVANIPYYITSALIRQLSEAIPAPIRIVLTIQREVAERICQKAGNLNLLAISVQIFGKPNIRAKIPPHEFYPEPEVDSAVIRIDRYKKPLIPIEHQKLFFRLVKAGFSQKRKTLRNSISAGMHWNPNYAEQLLIESGIKPTRRAETLSIQEWYLLTLNTSALLTQFDSQ